jgi:outer membrane protein assembly factor BamD
MTRQIIIALMALAIPAGLARAEEAILKDGKWVTAPAPAQGTAAGEVALARKMLRQNNNRGALSQAKDVIKEYPQDAEAREEAMSLAGEAELARRRYWQSFEWFEKQIAAYPLGALLERALVREASIADAFLAGKKRLLWGFIPINAQDDGITIHERVADRAPGTRLAEECLMKVGDFLSAKRRWEEAAQAYDRYCELFRGRYRSREAEFKAACATYNQFNGVAHDDTPLVEGEQRFKNFVSHYPNAAEAPQALGAVTEIEQAKARKDYETARFYIRVSRRPAAVFYYRQAVQLYPGTPAAEKSAKALAEMGESAQAEASPAASPAPVPTIPPAGKPERNARTGKGAAL